ncbi:Homeodomain protein [Pseudocohnilembus persalinus]|uniref:Homeodomain protein n=1 Tax=Pseudocohnilembus persalinus TaxID=266149 RepID=A0A0V0QNN7_PSEPJ|nr:Homeodomain protein [Pseudocohnilembus persalinus]|eukprot:KRX03935.1 Homeodomain protein [Pseudocohnilembus persalinus]
MFNIQQQEKQDNFFDSPQDYEVLKAFEFLKTQNNRENSEFNINYEIENSQETEVIYQSDESSEISDIKSQKLYNYQNIQNGLQTSEFVEKDEIEDLKILEENQGLKQIQMQKVNQNGSVQSIQLIQQCKIEDQNEKNEEESLSIIQDELSQINEKKIGSGFSDFKYNSPPSNLCKRTNLNLRKSLQITQSASSHQQNYSDKENNNQQGRKTLDPQMEDNLIKWIKSSKLQNQLITRNDILQKAKQFSQFPQKFKASKGWLARFIKRTNLKKYISSGYSLNQQQKQQQQQNMQDYNNLDNDTEIKIVKQLNHNGQRIMTQKHQQEISQNQIPINYKNTDFLFGQQINNSRINHREIREFKCINIR